MQTMLGSPHRHFTTLDSTNEFALTWGREGAPHGAVVTADAQTAGRGRRGRSWSSPAGKGLYVSLILRPGKKPEVVPQLNFLACLAATRALHEITGLEYLAKWPNDVLFDNRKIGGLLSEAEFNEGKIDFVVIGLGLNLNQRAEELPERPLYPATSLLLETGRQWPAWPVAQAWLHAFNVFYTRLMRGEWHALREEFWHRCAQRGQDIEVQTEKGIISGTAMALDVDGALLITTENGVQRVLTGDLMNHR